MNIEIITLLCDNRVVCTDGQIPIILEAHLERIMSIIVGKNIVMGSKTFNSLGGTFSLADNTIVLTRNGKTYGNRVKVANSIISVMDTFKDFVVIGGASTFADFIPIANKLYITEVQEPAQGTKLLYFPKYNNFKLLNPEAEVLEEKGHYFRLLEYKR